MLLANACLHGVFNRVFLTQNYIGVCRIVCDVFPASHATNFLLGLDPREARTARGPQLVAAMLPENCGGNAVYISASDQHSCVVTDTGDLYTWGASGEDGGALGLGQKRWQPFAKRVPSLKKVRHARGFSVRQE